MSNTVTRQVRDQERTASELQELGERLQATIGGELDAGDGLAAGMAGTTPADLVDPPEPAQ